VSSEKRHGHPFYGWLRRLSRVRHKAVSAWVSPDDEEAETLPIWRWSIDEIRCWRTLVRPSAEELQFLARSLTGDEEPEIEHDDHPSFEEVKLAWLEPQADSLRGIRRRLPPKRELLRTRFYLSHGPGFDQYSGFMASSFDNKLAVLFYWNDWTPGFDRETPEWLMLRPLGLIERSKLIPSACLLLQKRAMEHGTWNRFEQDGPGWEEAQCGRRRIRPVDLYRILLAESGFDLSVVLDLTDRQLKNYRTPAMKWAYGELQIADGSSPLRSRTKPTR
jgi:hypothetical protein